VPLYHTGLFSTDETNERLSFRCGQASFEIEPSLFVGTPAELDKRQESIREQRGRPPVMGWFDATHRSFDAEITIRAANLQQANTALNLVVSALAVVDMGVQFVPEPFDLHLVECPAPPPIPFHFSRHGLLRACLLASRASRRRDTQYAVHRMALSYRSVSPHVVDLDPAQSPRLFGVERDSILHVYLANAITLAYSVVEQLKLEVRVKGGEASKMPDGSWNARVRHDLENRLKRAKIDCSDQIVWTLRGPKTKIEVCKKPPIIRKSKWSRNHVRDAELDILDAIALASWLRSKISTHRLGGDAASLTVYDAHNVQHVARRLLMESLSTWN
jgi:hypothetical protein